MCGLGWSWKKISSQLNTLWMEKENWMRLKLKFGNTTSQYHPSNSYYPEQDYPPWPHIQFKNHCIPSELMIYILQYIGKHSSHIMKHLLHHNKFVHNRIHCFVKGFSSYVLCYNTWICLTTHMYNKAILYITPTYSGVTTHYCNPFPVTPLLIMKSSASHLLTWTTTLAITPIHYNTHSENIGF